MKAVFLDVATIDCDDLDLDPLRAQVSELIQYPTTTPAQVGARLAGAEVAFINKIRLDAETLARHASLRLVCLAATGTDNIDLTEARRRGIAVSNIRDYCSESVAQHVFALVLTAARSLDGYRMLLSRGAWREADQFCLLNLPIRDLSALILGVVGRGALGAQVARLGEAFGMQVVFAGRRGEAPGPGRVDFDETLRTVDVLTLHCPLTEKTRGLLGAREFAHMKHSAIVINTARGALIDSAALATALRDGQIAAAGIDVLPQEPPVDGDPLLEDDIPNLIVTPHIAWASAMARQKAIDEMALNVAAFRDGSSRNRVA